MNYEKINEIKTGMEFKSYRMLCSFLGEKIKGGDSKKSQIKEWKRYFNFHKDGNSFIIDEVYKEPKEKEDLRKYSGELSNKIQPLLLDLIAKNNNNYTTSISNIALEVGLNNENFKLALGQGKNLLYFLELEENDVAVNILEEIIIERNRSNKDSIKNSIRALCNKGIITCTENVMLCFLDEKERKFKEATQEDIIFLEKCKSNVSKKNFNYFTYKRRLNDEIKYNIENKDNILYFFTNYSLSIIDNNDYKLSDKEKSLLKNNLNKEIINRTNKSSEKKSLYNGNEEYEKWGEDFSEVDKKIRVRSNKMYTEISKILVDKIININASKIVLSSIEEDSITNIIFSDEEKDIINWLKYRYNLDAKEEIIIKYIYRKINEHKVNITIGKLYDEFKKDEHKLDSIRCKNESKGVIKSEFQLFAYDLSIVLNDYNEEQEIILASDIKKDYELRDIIKVNQFSEVIGKLNKPQRVSKEEDISSIIDDIFEYDNVI